MSDFIFKDKNANQGRVVGLNNLDVATLNNIVEAINIMGQSASAHEWIERINNLVPAGTVINFAGPVIPDNYLPCNGALVSRTDYADLFEAIGTYYGAGDGSTTFALPDTNGKYIMGAGSNVVGTALAEQLPNILGTASPVSIYSADGSASSCRIGSLSGAFSKTGTTKVGYYTLAGSTSSAVDVGMGFNASDSNSTYTNNGTVRPNSLTFNYIIKY